MVSLSKFISLPIFIISLAIGLFVVYFVMKNEERKVFIYPNPENKHVIQYKDNTGMCYEFKETEVDCPVDESKITQYKPQ